MKRGLACVIIAAAVASGGGGRASSVAVQVEYVGGSARNPAGVSLGNGAYRWAGACTSAISVGLACFDRLGLTAARIEIADRVNGAIGARYELLDHDLQPLESGVICGGASISLLSAHGNVTDVRVYPDSPASESGCGLAYATAGTVTLIPN